MWRGRRLYKDATQDSYPGVCDQGQGQLLLKYMGAKSRSLAYNRHFQALFLYSSTH